MTLPDRDRIQLRRLRLTGTHGALPEERTRIQPFEVDVDIECDLSVAGQSDRLGDTIDYGSVVEVIRRIVSDERHDLLERLAERIAEELLLDTSAAAATVTVRKMRPPVPADIRHVGVRITRRRPG